MTSQNPDDHSWGQVKPAYQPTQSTKSNLQDEIKGGKLENSFGATMSIAPWGMADAS